MRRGRWRKSWRAQLCLAGEAACDLLKPPKACSLLASTHKLSALLYRRLWRSSGSGTLFSCCVCIWPTTWHAPLPAHLLQALEEQRQLRAPPAEMQLTRALDTFREGALRCAVLRCAGGLLRCVESLLCCTGLCCALLLWREGSS